MKLRWRLLLYLNLLYLSEVKLLTLEEVDRENFDEDLEAVLEETIEDFSPASHTHDASKPASVDMLPSAVHCSLSIFTLDSSQSCQGALGTKRPIES